MNYIHIGKIVATYGVNGELVLKHTLNKTVSFKKINVIFIEHLKNNYLPYFVKSGKSRSAEESLILLEDVHSKESAHKLLQKNVWLLQEDFNKIADKSFVDLVGYLLINEGKTLAPVEEVIQHPHQILLKIMLNGSEALIPLHEETLNKIDRKKKEIYVTLPDGLLEIYI
jgi:16S rRNA processing protein RimM